MFNFNNACQVNVLKVTCVQPTHLFISGDPGCCHPITLGMSWILRRFYHHDIVVQLLRIGGM